MCRLIVDSSNCKTYCIYYKFWIQLNWLNYDFINILLFLFFLLASGSYRLDAELVNEVLEDIPRHEEDYLDVSLEEEEEVIALMKSYLQKSSSQNAQG